ncbi:hypothetical protein SAMN02800692_0682 [Luteibacter sp. UNC138MFCol5.1]|uniref:hypothetical protein n=1 Tax=Luteibacter sp. UNC138MFCol5.1 TaxID=1502774 RepID=UPI0008CCF7CA|nr:hypothetical protein [Luteibacter sp. UNC138MFCol5.1]SEO41638.1 hypothetical protein SAMN02800692_0682 [Luteibacter sp. UNC138MFCol5.1]
MGFILKGRAAHDSQRNIDFVPGRIEPMGNDRTSVELQVHVRCEDAFVTLLAFSGSVTFEESFGYRYRVVVTPDELEHAMYFRDDIARDLEPFKYLMHVCEGVALAFGNRGGARTKTECTVAVREDAFATSGIAVPLDMPVAEGSYTLAAYSDDAWSVRGD